MTTKESDFTRQTHGSSFIETWITHFGFVFKFFQNMLTMHPQALDGSIAVESASKDVQWDLKEGSCHSGYEF